MSESSSQIVVEHLFAAPFLQFFWKDSGELNHALRELILAQRQHRSSVGMSNVGGWQSSKDLHAWEHEAIDLLVKRIHVGIQLVTRECVGEEKAARIETPWQIVAWANVNEPGDYNNLHNHRGGFWSGVYYVQTGDEKDAGKGGGISFRNPTLAPLAAANLKGLPRELKSLFESERTIQPREGMMLLFPSWLEHQVHPHGMSAPRISISFDAFFP